MCTPARNAGGRLAVVAAVLSCAAVGALPLELRNAGILGNSGESGESLVLTGLDAAAGTAVGAGVAVDPSGAIWCRGVGTLLKLAPDGRQLAQFPLPAKGKWDPGRDVLAIAGNHVVTRYGDALFSLPLDAPPGTAATRLPPRTHSLSFSATADGRLAATFEQRIFLVDPATGETEDVALAPERPDAIEADADGTLYVRWKHRLHRYSGGVETAAGWPRGAPGDRMQLLDGHWWCHAWHGTVKRHSTADMRPDPGVVLGGNSGSFIGHLDENPDVNNGRGMAKFRDGVYLECGGGGVVTTLDWDPGENCLKIRRRLGPLAACSGLAIDGRGRVFCGSEHWEWGDGPDAPFRHGVPPAQSAPGAVVGESSVLIPCWVYSTRPSVFTGTLDKELSSTTLKGPLAYGRDIAALAVWRESGQNWMAIARSDGTAVASRLGGNLLPAGDPRELPLGFRASPTALRSLVARPSGAGDCPDGLVAAVDGFVADLAREGEGFVETARWNRWGTGPGDCFGDVLHLHAHSGRLWVSDTARHRVLVFDMATAPSAPLLLAEFGHADRPGRGMDALCSPTYVAAHGDRAVVYDSGNQRIVKLVLSLPAGE